VTAAHQPTARPGTGGRSALPVLVLAWLIPGAGHVLHGDVRRGGILFVTLTAMFAVGIAFGGRLFPFQLSEWLVFLAAVAQWGAAVPRLIAGMAGVGDGDVVAITYEYGNTFLMASGLLNALVVLDVYDRARGLKGAGSR
jgi:hypothetical protein